MTKEGCGLRSRQWWVRVEAIAESIDGSPLYPTAEALDDTLLEWGDWMRAALFMGCWVN